MPDAIIAIAAIYAAGVSTVLAAFTIYNQVRPRVKAPTGSIRSQIMDRPLPCCASRDGLRWNAMPRWQICSVAILSAVVLVGLACGSGGSSASPTEAPTASAAEQLFANLEATLEPLISAADSALDELVEVILSIDPAGSCAALHSLSPDEVGAAIKAAYGLAFNIPALGERVVAGCERIEIPADLTPAKDLVAFRATQVFIESTRDIVAGNPTRVFLEAEVDRTNRNLVLSMLRDNGRQTCDSFERLSATEIGEWALGTSSLLSIEGQERLGLAFIDECERNFP